jgi:hypothetical protein
MDRDKYVIALRQLNEQMTSAPVWHLQKPIVDVRQLIMGLKRRLQYATRRVSAVDCCVG